MVTCLQMVDVGVHCGRQPRSMLRTMAGLAVGCIVPDGACTGFDLGQLFGAINSTTVRRAAMSHPLILAMNACPVVCY